jgi:hypothetical protein
MTKDFSTTVCGTIATDPTNNQVSLTLKGVPEADLSAFLSWLSDWVPICDHATPPPGPAAISKGKS